MQISDFDGLVLVAKGQPRPQRMLFVFLRTSLQDDATPEERQRFEAGEGGALLPLFCVDFAPLEVGSMEALAAQADLQSTEWDKVLVACIDEPRGASARSDIDHALTTMIGRVRAGESLGGMLCFSRDGTPVLFA